MLHHDPLIKVKMSDQDFVYVSHMYGLPSEQFKEWNELSIGQRELCYERRRILYLGASPGTHKRELCPYFEHPLGDE